MIPNIPNPSNPAMATLDIFGPAQGDFIVIRYEGPKGGPGMREMLTPTPLSRNAEYMGSINGTHWDILLLYKPGLPSGNST